MSMIPPALRIPNRRNAELFLLVFAVLIVVAAEAAVESAQDGRFSGRLIAYAAVPIGVGIVTHLVIRKVAPYADPLLLPIAVLLNGLGLVMIHRLDPALKSQAASLGESYSNAAPPQVLWTAVGVVLFVGLIVLIRDHRVLQRYAYTLALIGLVLVGIISAFTHWIHPTTYAWITLAIFTGLVLIDFARIRAGGDGYTPVQLAVQIYLDAINIFLAILSILGGRRSRD